MIKNKNIAFIDTEGITVRIGGSNKNKITTSWIKRGCILLYYCETKIIQTYNFVVNLPHFKTMDNNVKKQWKYTHKIHKTNWNEKGEDYKTVLKFVHSMVEGMDFIFAKGKFLEERFLWGLKMRLYDALKKNGMLVAEEDIGNSKTQVIGFLLADINIEPSGRSTGYIRTVIIDESARGKGVGKELVTHAINYLKTMDVDSILVNVRAATQTARKLYENLGFQELYRVMEYPISKKKKEEMKLPDNYMNGTF